jgi:hypothetical protein
VFYQVLNSQGLPLLENNGRPLFIGNWEYGFGWPYMEHVISDGQGGAIVIAMDNRDGTWDIYGQRIGAQGNRLWGETGLPLAVWSGNQEIIPLDLNKDSSGNYFLSQSVHTSTQSDLYIQKFRADGSVLWGIYGRAIRTNLPNGADYQQSVPDGEGGIMDVWVDFRINNMTPRLYFQHLNFAGNPLLTHNGILVDLGAGYVATQFLNGGVPDGAGGGIWSFTDHLRLMRLNGMGRAQWIWDSPVLASTQGPFSFLIHPSDGMLWFSCWEDRTWHPGIYLYRFTLDGQPLFGHNGLPYGGKLVPTSDGVISSVVEQPTNYFYSRRIASGGNLIWQVYTFQQNFNAYSCDFGVGADDHDGAVCAYEETRNLLTQLKNIVAQRVNPDGTLGTPGKIQPPAKPQVQSRSPRQISYVLDQAGTVTLELYDLLGRRLAILEKGYKEAGQYTFHLQENDWASGLYLVRINTESWQKTIKVVIAR